MDSDKIRRVRDIFEAALAQQPDVRRRYLAETCAEDAELADEVASLLDAHERGHELIDRPALMRLNPASAREDESPLPTGSVLSERFEILGLLGRGGMGEVYQAWDTILQRKTALKFVAQDRAYDPAFRHRLQREARALAALRHPHICAVHDVCSHKELDFVVMEYLEGETLAARLRREGSIRIDELVRIALQTLQCA